MATKFCRRCLHHRPDYLFQAPVEMCLLCYAMLAGNAEIRTNFPALQAKARRSRYARRRVAENERMYLQEALDASARSGVAAQLPTAASKDATMTSCDGPCRRLFDYDKLHADQRSVNKAEYPPMLCDDCQVLRKSLPDEQFAAQFYMKGEFWGHDETEEEVAWKASHFKG